MEKDWGNWNYFLFSIPLGTQLTLPLSPLEKYCFYTGEQKKGTPA